MSSPKGESRWLQQPVCKSGRLGETTRVPYRGAHRVAHTEVEAALLVHGVMQTGELRQRRPVVVEGVVAQTVVGAG